MRIWHTELVPKLCRSHLLAVWREGLGIYSILSNDKMGYRKHPAVKEWEGDLLGLYMRLSQIRVEMLRRGYNPKHIPVTHNEFIKLKGVKNKEWQTLDEQIEVLKAKGCECLIN